jgi:hypothetical protein
MALGAAALALLLHGAHLLYLARAQGCASPWLLCGAEVGSGAPGDYGSYRSVAERIRERGLFGASYLRRGPGYPLLLLLSEKLTGQVSPVRWLGPLGAALAAGATTWLAGLLAGRLRGALVGALLFGLWLDAYRFSAALRPDGLHAFLAVAALAASIAWRRSERGAAGWLAAGLWAAAQALRPTFVALPLILPALLWKRTAGAGYRRGSLALWLATLAVPAFLVGMNRIQHGVAVPSYVLAVNLACYAVPRLEEELGQGSFHALRQQCKARFKGLAPALRIPAQLRHARNALLEQPGAALASFLRELREQTFHPLQLFDVESRRSLYPSWGETGTGLVALFWLCAAAGLVSLARSEPGLALFLALAFALVMLPATTSHLPGSRLRFPVDLLFLPVAAGTLLYPFDRVRGASASGSVNSAKQRP